MVSVYIQYHNLSYNIPILCPSPATSSSQKTTTSVHQETQPIGPWHKTSVHKDHTVYPDHIPRSRCTREERSAVSNRSLLQHGFTLREINRKQSITHSLPNGLTSNQQLSKTGWQGAPPPRVPVYPRTHPRRRPEVPVSPGTYPRPGPNASQAWRYDSFS